MIKNEKQYKISKKKLGDVLNKIDSLIISSSSSLKQKMVLASLEDFKSGIEKEIKDYEALKSGKSLTLKERNISELPSLIIEYKIAKNLTHKEFSKMLGLKEQQLQRYEAEGFKTVSFQNLVKFISLMDMDLKVKETILKHLTSPRSTIRRKLSKF